ncbi:acylphosphatase [Cellulomonas sp. NPDC089187]|uniref:acylphosphatase n=1 Tax=Cellulomonas sp. NPDC089187 TaxID=3154970 RepID=UPI0034231F5B
MQRRRVVVRGRVQGVGFRWSAHAEAERLGLSGWVANRDDGSVEAVIEEPADAVARMVEWLGTGPRAARVDTVDIQHEEPEGVTGFGVRA